MISVAWATDAGADDCPLDFVEGLLLDGSFAAIYGEPGIGKSFVALDLAMHIALGRRWRGRDVDQGGVIYAALEGGGGVRRRIAAWRQHHALDVATRDDLPLGLITQAIDLTGSDDPEALACAVNDARRTIDQPVRLVVIDTISRALAGGNENAPEVMGGLVRGADLVREQTGACVLAVHHCGKDAARGMRGHTALRGALDTEIAVERAEGAAVATMRVTKQRDLELADLGAFRLAQVELGTDRRGRRITSAVAMPEDAAPTRARTVSRALRQIHSALINALAKHGKMVEAVDMPRVVAVAEAEWRAEAYAMTIADTDKQDSRRKAFVRASNALLASGIAAKRGDYVWLV